MICHVRIIVWQSAGFYWKSLRRVHKQGSKLSDQGGFRQYCWCDIPHLKVGLILCLCHNILVKMDNSKIT